MSAAKPKPFLDSDGDSLLSPDERRMYNAMKKHSNAVDHVLADHLYADIYLRGAARNYAEYADDPRHDVRYMMELRRAAVLYVREALLATDNDLIKAWEEGFDEMIRSLDMLRKDMPTP
jgi:hypothetical protein